MHKIIAANWKMYKNTAEARATITELREVLQDTNDESRSVIIFPPFTAIQATFDAAQGSAIAVGAQDIFPAKEGAFTGEISPAMVQDCGATWVLTGHSERRHVIGESDEVVNKKTIYALHAGLNVIVCIGETLAQREAGQLYDVLSSQLQKAFENLPTPLRVDRIAVAYEPVWAIGTGQTATNPDILEAHAIIRDLLKDSVGALNSDVHILYGGSVKPENAKAILALENVDGVLVGGAALQAQSFAGIIQA